MAYQVVDAAGRVLDLEDDEIVPDGCSLRVSTVFMDSSQREVMQDGEQQQKVRDAYAAFKDRVGAGMRRHRVPMEVPDGVADGEDFDHRAAAYDAMKKRLSGAWKARRARKPVDPKWLRL